MANVPHRKRLFTDEEVISYRRAFAEGWCKLKVDEIAKLKGVARETVGSMLAGRSYKHLPGAIQKKYRPDARRMWDAATVLKFRREYAADETVSPTSIIRDYGGDYNMVRNALIGASYKDVPEPITKLRPIRRNLAPMHDARAVGKRARIFTPEVALFIRLQYKPGIVSYKDLATAYGCNESQIGDVVNHRRYREVPFVPIPDVYRGPLRVFSDEDVAQARYWAYRGIKTIKQIAKHFGRSMKITSNMIRGKTYGHLPNAVPIPMYRLMRMKHKPVKIGTVKFADHDERVDLITLRSAA